MDRRGHRASDAIALRHPLFWVALALLIANDHLLKGAGILPGWLTGKLSDFAGLLVAPVLLSAILRARTSQRRGLAFASVAAWFTAVKLVPPAAHASIAIAGAIGFDWTIAADSTDLVALSILPLAWHVASHRGARIAPRAWSERLAIGLGVAACVASPPSPPAWSTAAFLVNRTTEPVDVRVRWVDARVDCSAIRERFDAILTLDELTPGTLYTLEPDHTLPLDRGVANATDPFADAGTTGHVGTCDVALLSIEGIPDQMVFWDGLSLQTVTEIDNRHLLEGGLELQANADGTLRVDASPGYTLAPPVDADDDGACHDYGSISGYGWSDLPDWNGARITLTDVHEGIDGCMSIAYGDELDVEQHAYVCVPAVDFPFASGNEVQIWQGENELRIVRDLVREDGTTWRVAELVVHRNSPDFSEGPFALSVVQVDTECLGVHMDCGGFRVPGAGGIQLTDGTRFVNPGEAMERDSADGRRARLRVGRAETMWVTRDACGAGRDQLGSRLEALVVYGEQTR